MWLPDGHTTALEPKYLELPMVHLVSRIHHKGLSGISLKFRASEPILLPEVDAMHFRAIVVFKSLDFIQEC